MNGTPAQTAEPAATAEPPPAAPTGGETSRPRTDRTPPRLSISRALMRVDARQRLPLSLRCRAEACAGQIRVTAGRTPVASGAFVLAADQRTTVRLKVARRALPRGKTTAVAVRIVVRDRAGNVRRITARLRARGR